KPKMPLGAVPYPVSIQSQHAPYGSPRKELFANASVAWASIGANCVGGHTAFIRRIIREGFLSTSQSVAQHLPYLRRYARALAGNQQAGDGYVAETLEAVIEDPKILETGASTRVALYQVFTKIWNAVPINDVPTGPDPSSDQAVERHLSQIAPMPRQAFLLVALEGLSED